MRCFVLGTGGMMPMPRRRLTSVVVRPSSRMYQFDAGEGVQVAVKELRLGIKVLDVIAVSHLHADHCLGLPGLLMFRAQCDEPGPLTVLGPAGLGRFVEHVLEDLSCFVNFDVEIREWHPGADPVAYVDEEVALRWAPLVHGVPCLGYRLEEHTRPGRFDPEAARRLGVPEGPLWGSLQRGEPVDLGDGETVVPEDVLGPPRRGRAVAFCTDTAPCAAIDELCEGADVAFVESMFLHEDLAQGRRKQHLTAVQAAEITRDAGVARTVLVHFSPRYGPAELLRMEASVTAANSRAELGRELMTFDVPLPDEPACP